MELQQPVDDLEIDRILIAWRKNLLNQLFRAGMVFAFIGIMVVFISDAIPNPGVRPMLAAYVVVYLVFATAGLRTSMNQRTRGWIFIWAVYMVALFSMARGGLAGVGRLFLLSLPVLATILVGPGAATVMAVIMIATMVGFTVLAAGGISESWIFEAVRLQASSPQIWLTETIYSFTIMGLLLVLVRLFHRFLIQRIQVEREASRAVNQAHAELAESNVQLEEKVARRTAELEAAVDEAQVARASAESASQIKSDFLATMSHEIRTPLNSILGMTSLLLDTPLTVKQSEYTETIRSSSEQLLSLINDILDFSKIEAERMDLEQTPFLLRQCLQNVIGLVAPRAREKGIELFTRIDPDTPRTIIGDETRLRQILVNLLGNAVKFTDKGQVEVRIHSEPLEPLEDPRGDADPRVRLIFSVQDTGIGISSEQMARLFQPFSQGDASTTRRYGGTGLGLVISKRLVEMMGGKIWVESKEGLGTTFFFTIETCSAPNITAKNRSETQCDLRDKRILVVEANATSRRILVLQLQAWNMMPRATGSPAEAIQWLRQGEKFDGMLIDRETVGRTPAEQVENLARFCEKTGCPLILLDRSEISPTSSDVQALISAHLVKPFKASALYNALIDALGSDLQAMMESPDLMPQFDPQMGQRHPLRILVVEDNDINQHLMLLLLERMGYRADVAGNGIEALQAIQRQPYDAVLMDVQMPDMDGFAATQRIRQDFPAAEQPRIIAMTANAMRGDRELCLAAGMDDYISKPIYIEELIGCLNRCASRETRDQTRLGVLPAAPGKPSASLLNDGVPVLDMAELLRLQENLGYKSETMVPPLVASFFKQVERLLEELKLALAAGDLEKLRRAAHTLKSNGATFGARRLEAAARQLEEQARQGSTDHVEELICTAINEYQRAHTALKEAQAAILRDSGHKQDA